MQRTRLMLPRTKFLPNVARIICRAKPEPNAPGYASMAMAVRPQSIIPTTVVHAFPIKEVDLHELLVERGRQLLRQLHGFAKQ